MAAPEVRPIYTVEDFEEMLAHKMDEANGAGPKLFQNLADNLWQWWRDGIRYYPYRRMISKKSAEQSSPAPALGG